MENSILVHVVDWFDDLVHVVFDSRLWQILAASFDCFIHVHVHELKNECKSPSRFVIENFIESDYVWMRGEAFKSLNLAEVVNL